jgi:hypothetical protein
MTSVKFKLLEVQSPDLLLMDEGTLLRRIEIRYGRVARLLARMTKMKRPQNSEHFKSEVNGWTLGACIITMTVLGIRKATTGQVCARYYKSHDVNC